MNKPTFHIYRLCIQLDFPVPLFTSLLQHPKLGFKNTIKLEIKLFFVHNETGVFLFPIFSQVCAQNKQTEKEPAHVVLAML